MEGSLTHKWEGDLAKGPGKTGVADDIATVLDVRDLAEDVEGGLKERQHPKCSNYLIGM